MGIKMKFTKLNKFMYEVTIFTNGQKKCFVGSREASVNLAFKALGGAC